MNSTFFTHLCCSKCDDRFSPDTVQTVCPRCTAPILAEYDLDSARRALKQSDIIGRTGSLWRYRELLPVFDERNIISLGEGWSPLLHTRRLGHQVGLPHLYIKDESCNPTGSFKARGISLAISKAVELGISEVSMPSAGNAGGALAAYAAHAGIRAHVFVPTDTPKVNISEVPFYGANVYLVDGVISDAARRMNEMRAGTNWFDMSTMKEPYRLEGKKTMGYEVAEQLGWSLPDVIVYPTGGGTGLIGMWKAFRELGELGWISAARPKMVSVQTTGCAPIVEAFRKGKPTAEFWPNAQTVASGLRVPKPFADALILQAIAESRGTATAVSDEDLLSEMKHVASLEGIFLCPEGAAAVSAVRRLSMEGFIKTTDRVVVFNTGTGYKYVELFTGSG